MTGRPPEAPPEIARLLDALLDLHCSAATWHGSREELREVEAKRDAARAALMEALAPAPSPERQRLLEKVRHELTTLHGLYATDQPNAYDDALAEGCDSNGARDIQREATWRLDETALLKELDEALEAQGAARPEKEGRQP